MPEKCFETHRSSSTMFSCQAHVECSIDLIRALRNL
jgi:hypothetical protein